MQLGVSVIVCCYNSKDKLPDTLRHLAQQQVPPDVKWEIIIINNASTDNTANVARQLWKDFNIHHVNFEVIDQPVAGLKNAREKGVSHSRYDFMLFCDDDNWLSPFYVATVFAIMQADALIGVVGGCGAFEPEQPVQNEIVEFKNSYVIGPQTWAATDHYVYGAGCTYRKPALLDFYAKGWQPITLGRTGNRLTSGEDVELCFMYYLNGYKIVANDSLTFRHFVPLKRQNISYILKLYFWQSYSYVLLSPYLSLIDKDTRGLNNRLDDILLSTKKALIKELTKLAYQKLIRWKSIDRMQQFTLQSYYGTLLSVYQNKKKMIAHFNQLKKVLNKPLPPLQNGIVTAK